MRPQQWLLRPHNAPNEPRAAANTIAQAHESGRPGAGQPPREHPSRVLIENDGEKPPMSASGKIRQIGHPDLIGPRDPKPSHAVRLAAKPPMRARLRPIDARRPGSERSGSHQPFHPSTADAIAPPSEGVLDPRTPIRSVALLEDRTHFFE